MGEKRADVAILVSDNIDFDLKNIKINEEGCHIMIKGSIQQEEIIIINVYALNVRAPSYGTQY